MEKYVRVSDLNKDTPAVYTAEEIADMYRGIGVWVKVGDKIYCPNCGCASRDPKKFCTYCGSRNKG